MEFRPIDQELATACFESKFCGHCSCRHGCPIRLTFFGDDLDFEISLQSAEIQIRKIVPSELAYAVAHSFRKKREDELRLHKFFEY